MPRVPPAPAGGATGTLACTPRRVAGAGLAAAAGVLAAGAGACVEVPEDLSAGMACTGATASVLSWAWLRLIPDRVGAGTALVVRVATPAINATMNANATGTPTSPRSNARREPAPLPREGRYRNPSPTLQPTSTPYLTPD
jgi:hypothetical protein